jgi:RNase P subunit RPR2
MLQSLIDNFVCEACGTHLVMDSSATLIAYEDTVDLSIESLVLKVDDIIGKFLVFICPSCGAEYRVTYKDIERIIRRNITQKLLYFLVHEKMDTQAVNCPVFVYCGKCTGFDGHGACPKSVYDECDIKRFPLNV